jgi:sugar/nucleoside kinase (ribokinase family)
MNKGSPTREYDILVIGEANVDLIIRGDDVVPRFGQTEKLVEDAELDLGGSSAIFACGAGRLGLKVGFVGKLGEDGFGSFLINVLQGRGVDTTNIILDPNLKTGLTLHLSQPHDRAMLTYLGSIEAMKTHEIDPGLFKRARHVHLSSFYLQRGLQRGLAELFNMAKECGASLSLDPGWDPLENWNGYLTPVLDLIDIFLPNDQEAMKISSTHKIDDALKILNKRIPHPVIKMGKDGACTIVDSEKVNFPGFGVDSIDTTGAGDSFNAGFLYAYLNGYEMENCLRWGCACGAISTTKVGGINGQPTISDVKRFLSNH